MMKKTLLLLASAVLLFAGCAKEQLSKNAAEGDIYSFTVGVASEATKAVADKDGHAANVDHWIMQVIDSDGDVYNYQEKDATAGALTQTFNVPLIKGQTYQVLFWADTKGNYEVSDLRNVKRVESLALTANRDDLDAFSAVVNDFATTVATQQNIYLHRPFAQLNVVFTDLKKLYKTMGGGAEYSKFEPVNFVAKAKVPTSFNVLTQKAGDPAETALEMTAATNYKDNYAAHAEKATLYMDYILATKDAKDIVDIDFSFVSKDVTIAHNFTSIPFQRNWRTNIVGELMSAGATWEVVVDPEWDSENDVAYVAEGSVAAALEALAAGKTAIEITTPDDYDTPIALPAQADGKDISIKVSGVTGKDMNFILGEGAQGPANLYLTSDANNIVINLPNTHAEVNGGIYNQVTATTSATTLVVGKDVTIATLYVLAGNVEIHGKVASFTRENGVKAEMYASDRATLVNYINWAKSGEVVALECDIDLAGENWTPAKLPNVEYIANFDGCGHSIKNMTVVLDASNGTPYGGGFYENVYGNGVMKNVTFVNADVKSTVAGKGNVFGIAAGYAYGNVTFENITVKDSKVSAFGKVGGILGMAADPGTTVTTMKNCSLENVEITGSYNVANYIGLLQNNVDMSGCSSTNVEKKLSVRYGEDAYVTFDNVKVINKDEQNPKYVLSSGKYWKYVSGGKTYYYSAFADCYNDMKYESWKALDGTVDGLVFNTTDTPELKDLEAVATIGSTKYYDFYTALGALQEGQTLEILQAGEYTVETLSTPANTTIDAKVDGVVFNHTPGSGWVANQIDGRTVKNITWNVGTAKYQYFHGVNLVNCKVNGLLCTHSNNTYTDCEFYNADDYNFWEYGSGSTFIRCKFTCPGKNDGVTGAGGCVNAYNEGEQGLKKVVFDNCQFIALDASNKYPAVYIKPESSFDIEFINCTVNDKFCTGDKSGSKLWNVKAHSNLNTKVTVDGQLVYAKGTVLNITTPDQLMAFAAKVNAGETFDNTTVSLGADIDMAGKAWIPIGGVSSYPSVTFYGTFDGANHTVSNLTCTDNTENYAAAGFFGSIMGTVKNLTLSNVNISSKHYAGGIVAYCSSSSLNVENCHVAGGSITSSPELLGGEYDNGDKAGGIVGLASEAGKITGCSVDGVTIRAYRDLGGIAGATNATISNCVVKNSSVIQDNTNAYKTGIDTFHEILGRDLGATLTGNTTENVTVKSEN